MILKGKTQKGKNRIRELGGEWTVIGTRDQVQFSTEVGPWWLVKPISGTDKHVRWIHPKHDINFEIVSM